MTNSIYKKYLLFIKVTCCVVMILGITGCSTLCLKEYIRGQESQVNVYANDSLVGITLSQDGKANSTVAFIGERFDYPLQRGGEKITKIYLLKENYLPELKITDLKSFMMGKTRSEFSGNIRFRYGQRIIDETTRDVLAKNGFECYGYGVNTGPCYLPVNALQGTIQKKGKIPDNRAIRYFEQPYPVTFYKKNGLSAARVLYPVAVVVDIVTSPFQLLALAIYDWR
ncbi:hypothetical protein ACKLKD_04410 [Klebsiella sp. 10982]|uniref:Lipoprotein n=1 Tax=Klebsiella quasivariicola TaxID=2026240 RepID=A0A5E5TPQ2_9ENTR|nr:MULTISPECIES: hypothetical protein [Klebsiella]MEA1148518.1 hypothetical protein [Klebsiella pneumoniae]QBL49699.1 hypothetical protein BMD99_014810 [Klebsiella sp. PO552]MBF7821147.1 hypothetical protein [Klebsiella quasivariicola]MBK2370696.1 hypothetical protein [Klebsiella quasivariicola]MBS5207942.1 hypothetical protein [Klebsiella sp.]